LELQTNKIKVLKNIRILSEEFCTELVNEVSSQFIKKDKINIALSGGKTPKAIFRKLVSLREKINWQKIDLFWVDERCVPPDDPESNYGMTKKHLLNHIDIPPENINRIKGENIPSEEAKRYSDVVETNLVSVNKLPTFEIMLLGLGEDGHTASIFPDQMELLESDKICEVAFHPTTKQKRITITVKVINNSRRIYFLVSGKNKASVVGKILNKGKNHVELPGSYIKPVDGEVIWFLDKEAASEINQKV
jgi:6-phosphogluconolactonase